jgi:hypothetical protein
VEIVGMSLVQLYISEMQAVDPLVKFYFNQTLSSCSCTIRGRAYIGLRADKVDLIVSTCASTISTITVGKSCAIPAKQLRENTITMLDLSNKGLGVDGGQILAALFDGNTSLQYLDVSSNSLGPEGGKAIAASIAENSTLTSVSSVFSLFILSICCSHDS